jgi:hypothetical protein
MKSALVAIVLFLAVSPVAVIVGSPAASAQVTAGNSGVAAPGLNRGNHNGLNRGRGLPVPLAGVGLSLLAVGGGYVAFVNHRRRRRVTAEASHRTHGVDAV